MRRGPRRPTGRSLRARLDSLERRHAELANRPDLAAERLFCEVYFSFGLCPAEPLSASWRRAVDWAWTICLMANSIPSSPDGGREEYPGARGDTLISATLPPKQRKALEKLSHEKFQQRWHELRLDLYDRTEERAASLRDEEPRLDRAGSVRLALRELEREAGVPEDIWGFPMSTVAPLRSPPPAPTEPRWPAGFAESAG